LPEFRNERYTDFSQPENRRQMEEALADVRSLLGREYDLIIGGERVRTPEKLKSVNPARPSELVGLHQKATPELANRAIETAWANFQ
jgi:1-pyrroline-5-carboxylate dehydrogenase